MSDLEIKVLVGIPASGKSTYARTLSEKYNLVSYDAMRFAFFRGVFNQNAFDYLRAMEEQIIRCSILSYQKSICIDNTNLERSTRKQYIALAQELGVLANAVYIEIPLEDALRRNADREGHSHVPESRMQELFSWLQPPCVEEGFYKVERITQEKLASLIID